MNDNGMVYLDGDITPEFEEKLIREAIEQKDRSRKESESRRRPGRQLTIEEKAEIDSRDFERVHKEKRKEKGNS